MWEISCESSEPPEESSSPFTGVDARLGSATLEDDEDRVEEEETFFWDVEADDEAAFW